LYGWKVRDLTLETATKNHPEPGFWQTWSFRGEKKEGIATMAIKKKTYHWGIANIAPF
jgi:hypothetical protein